MKRRLLVLALLATPLAVQAQPADWQTVVGRDLRFRLETYDKSLLHVSSLRYSCA